jgi:hypothetical protein
LIWPIAGAPDGSFYFDNPTQHFGPIPGQQKHGRRRRPDQLDPPTVQIFKPPAMVNPDLYPKPIPFRGAPTRSSE